VKIMANNCPGNDLEECVRVACDAEFFRNLDKEPGIEFLKHAEIELRQELLRNDYRGFVLTSYLSEGVRAAGECVLEEYGYRQRISKKLFDLSEGVEEFLGETNLDELREIAKDGLAIHIDGCWECRMSYDDLVKFEIKKMVSAGKYVPISGNGDLDLIDDGEYFNLKLAVDNILLGLY
jgi:hypothetical protein